VKTITRANTALTGGGQAMMPQAFTFGAAGMSKYE